MTVNKPSRLFARVLLAYMAFVVYISLARMLANLGLGELPGSNTPPTYANGLILVGVAGVLYLSMNNRNRARKIALAHQRDQPENITSWKRDPDP